MSKMTDLIKAFADGHEEIVLLLPGVGKKLGKVVSLVDDVVTLAPSGSPNVAMHYTQFAYEYQ